MSYDPGIYRQLRDLEERLRRLEAVDRPATARGTWTPAFTGTTTAGTFAYVAQRGIYRRVNDAMFIVGQVAISAIAVAPVGNVRITGLPFTAANIDNAPYSLTVGINSNVNYDTGWLEITATILAATNYITLYRVVDNAATAEFPASQFTNTAANIAVAGWYLV